LSGDQKITPSEVRKDFSKLSPEEIPNVPVKIEVQIITLDPPVSPTEIDAIKTKLRGFKDRIEKGDATFNMLAMLYSDDLESAKQGGELGYMGKGQLVKPFADEAFNLSDPKKVSPVIETEYGYHILQLIDKRGDKVNVRHILIKPKASLSEQMKTMASLDSIVGQIRNGKISFETAAAQFSDEKNSRMNGGLMVNPQDGTTKFEYQYLPPEVSSVAQKMQVGEVSAPFLMVNQSGKQVCTVIKIKSKTDAHKANVDEDYQMLKTLIQNRKNEETISNWIAKKQKETYIRILPGWDKCNFQYPGWIKK
jgi:peptidyl-prolyl cis-trans isomerase SurA